MECCKCGVSLEPKKTVFQYLEHEMYQDVLCCPVCGRVFVTKELADGKMLLVEMELEEK